MKLKIKPYLLRLLRENAVYLFGLIFLFLLIIVIIKTGFDRIAATNSRIKTLNNDIGRLQSKAAFFQNTLPSTEKLDEDVKLLNKLIPNIEDYFSIIYSLETLSQKTGFVITGYSVNIGKSSPNKLKLSVTGVGDTNSFMKFLDEYNFEGGRLITSDKIELNPQLTGSIRIDLTFYSKTTSTGVGEITQDKKTFQELEAIKEKVNFEFSEASPEGDFDLTYPRKTNPF
ncbi:hypothetical protein HZA76_01565 [Candidatus Roizmanbacteria bacterium]|nr:hypothetical protein [Candidatus Roizmanbacteria bacterium]